jgi:predicted nuclease of restriction endonuclease-like RecB superfamily
MIPEKLLTVEDAGDGRRPRWLSARDEVWVRLLLDELDGLEGRTVEQAEQVGRVPVVGAPPRAAAAMRLVLARFRSSEVLAAAPPVLVRSAVFQEAVREGATRDKAIARAAATLGIAPDEVVPALYADRPGARRVVVAPTRPSPREAIELYHLALLQGLLYRSELLVVRCREHVRAVVRYAKLRGLLCAYAEEQGGTRIELSGPLSLFRHTLKYGSALASFVPALVATPGWSLEATVVLRGDRTLLHARAGDPIARTHALPADADSTVERRFARDFRRLGSAWTLARETAAVRAGGRLFFPDYTLRHGERVVYLEIVGYYTPEYLSNKLEAFRAAGLKDLVVCIDETLACGDREIEAAAVVRFKKRIDAAAVLAAAEALPTRLRSQALDLAEPWSHHATGLATPGWNPGAS